MNYVYILKSKVSEKYYIGCTNNLKRRITEHNLGLSKYTKKDRPWFLVHSESFDLLSQARKREVQIKNWKKRKAIEKLFSGPIV